MDDRVREGHGRGWEMGGDGADARLEVLLLLRDGLLVLCDRAPHLPLGRRRRGLLLHHLLGELLLLLLEALQLLRELGDGRLSLGDDREIGVVAPILLLH